MKKWHLATNFLVYHTRHILAVLVSSGRVVCLFLHRGADIGSFDDQIRCNLVIHSIQTNTARVNTGLGYTS